jgi:hypothetical protein
MTISYNPSAVINGLLLNVDFANPKSYSAQENLFNNSEDPTGYSAATRFAIFVNTATTLSPVGNTGSSLIVGIDGSTNYAAISSTYASSATGYYTMSYYMKAASTNTISMILGTQGYDTTQAGGLYFRTVLNLNNRSFSLPQLVTSTTASTTTVITDIVYGATDAGNGWSRCYITANFTTATAFTQVVGGIYVGTYGSTAATTGTGVYSWGWQLENSAYVNNYTSTKGAYIPKTLSVVDMISKNRFQNYYQPNYLSTTPSGYLQFNRYPATTSTQLAGGNLQITNPQGALSVTNFLYYDHTWEIWFRLDDINPVSYPGDPTQGTSALAIYNGFHAGFYYSNSQMSYLIWSSATNNVVFGSWSVGTGAAQINQGNWYQIALTKSGNTATTYLNGAQVGTGNSFALQTTNVPTNNNINIGAAYPNNPGAAGYVWYGKNSISIMRMYNRSLSASEINQNFNAHRGRYGI